MVHTRRVAVIVAVMLAVGALGAAAFAYHQNCGLTQPTQVGTGSGGTYSDTYICYSVSNPTGGATSPCGAQTVCGNVHFGSRPTDTGTSGLAVDVCVEPGACTGRSGVQTAGASGTTVGKTGLLVSNVPVGLTKRTGPEYVPPSGPIVGPPSPTCVLGACVPSYVNAGTVRVYADSTSPVVSQKMCVSYTMPCP